MSIYLGTKGYLDDIDVKKITRFEKEFLEFMDAAYPQVGEIHPYRKRKITDEAEATLKKSYRTV